MEPDHLRNGSRHITLPPNPQPPTNTQTKTTLEQQNTAKARELGRTSPKPKGEGGVCVNRKSKQEETSGYYALET